MTVKNGQLRDIIKRALQKLGIHVPREILERDISRVTDKIVREYIGEIKLRGKYCKRKGCGRKLRGHQILFCSTECGNSFHNDKKANARIAKDPAHPRRKQAKWRKAKALMIRKEYPELKNKVNEQENQISDLISKKLKLERDVEELREELLVNRSILSDRRNTTKPFKQINPESEAKSNISRKDSI